MYWHLLDLKLTVNFSHHDKHNNNDNHNNHTNANHNTSLHHHTEGATPPLPPTMAPVIGPCDDCKMLNWIGFNPHPDDCDKFVQCYFGSKGQLRVAYRQCPFGQYWDQSMLTCRPSEYVECEKGRVWKLKSFLSFAQFLTKPWKSVLMNIHPHSTKKALATPGWFLMTETNLSSTSMV